ncbi:MAG: TerC family protein [Bryobacteraceae bacterium]|nr:TerC family protein [Bryobacteraceae bacterium]
MDSQILLSALSIVLIDILLAGDNAVIIAMAVRSLPPRERKTGIMIGAGFAVVLRVVLTFFAAQLLQISWVKLIGGAAILWIGVKLLADSVDDMEGGKEAKGLWQAIWYIMIADITMSTDNILAVAGASHGNPWLLIFGLGLSIPFVVFTSNLLSGIMNRYPIVIWIGAAILGRVGAEMITTDPVVAKFFHPPAWLHYAIQAAGALAVVGLGRLLMRRPQTKAPAAPSYAD